MISAMQVEIKIFSNLEQELAAWETKLDFTFFFSDEVLILIGGMTSRMANRLQNDINSIFDIQSSKVIKTEKKETEGNVQFCYEQLSAWVCLTTR